MGSFVSASVWRLYKQSLTTSRKKIKDKEHSILYGRSMCPNCKHTLGVLDLIPLISWLGLRGKCRYCHQKISWQEPVVELISGLAFGFSYYYWPYSFNTEGKVLFIFWLVFLCGFMALTIYDLRWKLLPNKIVGALIILALVQLAVKLVFFHGGTSAAIGAFWGVLLTAGLFYGLFSVSGGRWIGGGDVKLGVALGLLIGGPAEALLMVFGASLIGTAISIPLLSLNKLKRSSMIAFGPLLIISTTVCYFFGPDIVNWYKNLVILGH